MKTITPRLTVADGHLILGDMDDALRPRTPEVVAALVENHREFIAFVERRVSDRALAEDIVQEAFARSIDRIETLAEEESIRAWFYRTLRNAVIDHYRRGAASARKLEALAAELGDEGALPPEVEGAVCRCIARLAATLKPEYADALTRIEVEGLSVKRFAEQAHISPSNAAVRVFRAREALRRQVAASCGTCAAHGCVDCNCVHPRGDSSGRST